MSNMETNPIIEAKNLGIKYKISRFKRSSVMNLMKTVATRNSLKSNGEFWGLRNLNFEVQKGDILGVLGKNGSGKSTLLRTIAGIYLPDEGEMNVNGTVSSMLTLSSGFKEDLTGVENIFLIGVVTGFTEKEIKAKFAEIVEFSELEDFIYQPVKSYSSGMKARLGFSIAISLKRDIMLVDEILGVGDFKFREKSRKKMIELIKSDITVVLVSHDSETIKEYSNKCIWIHEGELKAAGETDEMMKLYLDS
ncbi:MAG: ABC transporter ATP-binding protein [Flavobacteriales bacterium]|jgi:teichoic acid transport system ATP-binding protein|nr:ABC transporter ATP-binding protein [bacterium]MDG1175070.1 ABC transporter ATP-binding protein [Flavobacteriales bacterium]